MPSRPYVVHTIGELGATPSAPSSRGLWIFGGLLAAVVVGAVVLAGRR
jgi:hypothetical protein